MKNIKKILLVEDDREDQKIFEDSIHTVLPTVECTAVDSGPDALEVLTKGHLPDVIFMDMYMPKMDAIELLKIVKGIPEFANIPVVIYTHSMQKHDIERCIELGAEGVLKKATSLKEFASELKKVMDELRINRINS